ncbi:MAG: ABC transporter permease [Treponema sp.]|nr:ABC transporter permease [Treponema sp.]
MQRTINRIKTFFKYRELFFQLVSRDIKNKYRKSVLGYFWSILNPLLTMLVMAIIFSQIFDRVQFFPIYIIIGHLIFQFMAGSGSASMNSITGNASLLRKIYIPKYIFTLAIVTSELVTLFFSLGAFLILCIVLKVPFTPQFFLIIIPIMLVYIFNIGLGLFLAQAAVFFKDIVHIWGVIVTAWMYFSAIFYPVSRLPDWIRPIIMKYNPMYFYITLFRNFTIGTEYMNNLDLVIRGTIAAGIMLLIGLVSFTYSKNKFLLHI